MGFNFRCSQRKHSPCEKQPHLFQFLHMPQPKKPGRPRKEIDAEQVRQLAAINCSLDEMSAVLKVSVDTLSRNYADVIKEGRSTGRMSLKRKQYEIAMKGNVGMLIWLGKQLLEQREPNLEIKNITQETEKLSPTEMIAALRERAIQIEEANKQ